jgi:hypothetical protein
MGLVREIKERLSGVEAKARQLPVSGEGGIVALPSEQGTSILDHRRFNAYPTHRLGQIRSNGGTESLEDFTDEVYWVQFMRLGGSAQNVSPPLHPDLDEEAIAVPATNLAERTAESVGGEGTHRLPPGTVVLLFMEEDDEGNLRWVFNGALLTALSAKITGTEAGGGKYVGRTWAYPTADIPAAGNLTEAELGTTGAVDIRIVNPSEVGQGTHLLKTGTIVNVLFLRRNSDGTDVYQVNDHPLGVTSSPTTLGAASEGSEAADTSGWVRNTDGTPVEIYVTSRVGYFHAGDETLYAYVRLLSFDATGLLISVGTETRVSIEVPEDCS